MAFAQGQRLLAPQTDLQSKAYQAYVLLASKCQVDEVGAQNRHVKRDMSAVLVRQRQFQTKVLVVLLHHSYFICGLLVKWISALRLY